MNNFDMNKLNDMMSNNEEMSNAFNKFSNMVKEGNIPDEMKDIISSFSKGNSSQNQSQNNSSPTIDAETIIKMKKVMDQMQKNGDDPRANLLSSLKPYLKESRKDKADQCIKLLNMSKVMELFGNAGGEKQSDRNR